MIKWPKSIKYQTLLLCIGIVITTFQFLHKLQLHNEHIISGSSQTKLRRFYIYDWPENITQSWPTDYKHHRLSVAKHSKCNFGAGYSIDSQRGLYRTHQYALFPLVYNRLLCSKYRTFNPSEADAFFIPYDLGMDATTRSEDGALFQTNCPKVSEVIRLLNNSPYFRRNGGSDHFIIHSINQMMTYYANKACVRLYELCYNCTKFSIDTYPKGVYHHLDVTPFMTHKWISVPFPSNYHFNGLGKENNPMNIYNKDYKVEMAKKASTTITITQQQKLLQNQQFAMQRPFALSFVGTPQVTARKQRRLRLDIIETCKKFNKDCLLVELSSHLSLESNILMHNPDANSHHHSYRSSGSSNNPYEKARLCLMPGKKNIYSFCSNTHSYIHTYNSTNHHIRLLKYSSFSW